MGWKFSAQKEIDDVLEELKKREMKVDLKEGEDLSEKIKQNLVQEKDFRSKEKVRIAVTDSLIKETKVEVPKILVEVEMEKMLGQFKDDVSRAGIKWDEYLKSLNKKEDDIK